MVTVNVPRMRPPLHGTSELERLRKWVKDETERGVPLQHIEDSLMRGYFQHRDGFSIECATVAREVMSVMDHRHREGEDHEAAGHEEEAIRCYDENVRDFYMRPSSGERLIKILRLRGDEARSNAVLDALEQSWREPETLAVVPTR